MFDILCGVVIGVALVFIVLAWVDSNNNNTPL